MPLIRSNLLVALTVGAFAIPPVNACTVNANGQMLRKDSNTADYNIRLSRNALGELTGSCKVVIKIVEMPKGFERFLGNDPQTILVTSDQPTKITSVSKDGMVCEWAAKLDGGPTPNANLIIKIVKVNNTYSTYKGSSQWDFRWDGNNISLGGTSTKLNFEYTSQ